MQINKYLDFKVIGHKVYIDNATFFKRLFFNSIKLIIQHN